MAIEHIRRWQVGDVEIVRIVEIHHEKVEADFLFQNCDSETIKRHDWLLPHHATAEGSIILSFQAFAIKCGDRRIMVDTCIGDGRHRYAPIFHMRKGSFLEDLSHAGFPPASIDTVLCTHLHIDHVGWNTHMVDGRWVPTFPNARYLMNRTELQFLRSQIGVAHAETEHIPDSIQPVFDAGLVDFVSRDHRVTDELRLEPTPGHTPGHVSIHIASKGEHAVITGDLMHHPVQCAEPHLRSNFCNDHDQARETRLAFLERYQDRGALVIGSHFADPTAGWITRDGAAWRLSHE